MKIEINVVGNRVKWNTKMGDIGERLAEIGSDAKHEDLYTFLGMCSHSAEWHNADNEFTFDCDGFEKFVKDYIHPNDGTKEEVEARARELLVRIDDWLRGLERTTKRFTVLVEYPPREKCNE